MSNDTRAEIVVGYATDHLLTRILEALAKTGADTAALTSTDIKPVDEFHTGGIVATEHLLSKLDIRHGQRILDLGSGLGGTARLIAEHTGAEVIGIDLTPEFVDVANALSERVRLADSTCFLTASATDLPLPDNSFDHAIMIHVGMNIADKRRVFAETARVLRPGGHFGLFEIMQGDNPEPLAFPLPWALKSETSFLATPESYQVAAQAAGFELVDEEDRTDFALDFFDQIFNKVAVTGLPPLGIHLLMGETTRQKMTNYVLNTKAGKMCARELVFRVAM